MTLITAFILFILATAGVKGFAFTLGVGTLVSLFTAVLFTQAVLGRMGRTRLLHSPAMLGAGGRPAVELRLHGPQQVLLCDVGCASCVIGSFAVATKGLNFGIDFESGTRVSASLVAPPASMRFETRSARSGWPTKIQEVKNPELGENVMQIATRSSSRTSVPQAAGLLDAKYGIAPDGFSSESVGPTFGATVARSAPIAIIVSLLLIMGYVAFRFEPKFAIPVVIALFHDLLITAGVYSLTGREVTTSTVAALLTILGFSLYDTVIVFDRIRENAPRMPRATFSQIVNRSMSEVLTRSLATSFCTLLAGHGAAALRRRDAEGLRVRAARRDRIRYLLVDLHREPGADGVEGARAGLRPAAAADRSRSSAWCPPSRSRATAGVPEADPSPRGEAQGRPSLRREPAAPSSSCHERRRMRRALETPTRTSCDPRRRRRSTQDGAGRPRSAETDSAASATASRAERAERKKQRAPAQRRRKHGRRR